ncbi:MAG: carbonic anhydrase family protein [Verrucomicrobiales bacterium]|nr:carbonic anhydrase family protein [Verrucomicrobiales bacterium]
MNRFLLTLSICSVVFTSCERPTPPKIEVSGLDLHHDIHWSYDGPTGPSHWGELNPEWILAKSGKKQSPINLSKSSQTTDLPILTADYQATPLNLTNNGHTIVQSYSEGSSASISGNSYQLAQFHFHHTSEHTVDGNYFDMECHLVHKNEEGNLLVVGVLIKAGKENEFLKQFWSDLPQEEGKSSTATLQINVEDLLPDDLSYYHYQGSLTTPPCTEGVQWYVLSDPIEASVGQIAAFSAIFPKNNRPVQNLFDRKVVTNDE